MARKSRTEGTNVQWSYLDSSAMTSRTQEETNRAD